ncbi:MAG: phage tail sheath family protein [Flavobacteriales bacterium]|nr:phage tail sheath family protein [Flavobacteriales bacterium]
MAMSYSTPGVYLEEISKLPPSVAQVQTAIPSFIGYVANSSYQGIELKNRPTRIKSLKEFEEIFGLPQAATLNVILSGENLVSASLSAVKYRLHYSLQLYFANGGGPCYITSAGTFSEGTAEDDAAKLAAMNSALKAIQKEDEPTILVFPDALLLIEDSFYELQKAGLRQSATLMDRITLVDLFSASGEGKESFDSAQATFRTKIGNNFLSYGAAYYPYLLTLISPYLDETQAEVTVSGKSYKLRLPDDSEAAELTESLYHTKSKLYFDIKKAIEKTFVILPPSSAVAGIYCMVDGSRGVWKAPANVSLSMVKEVMTKIDHFDQEDMNVTGTGKSVNAIREFSGQGILVWGARTLAGNDNEWRYVSVRRFFNMVEESTKKASESFVFEPNDANTWNKVKVMIENFLTLQWRAGALQGAKPEDSFFVNVGLGSTMTAMDVNEGRMIVEIGMAVVRPAEFIILRFSHKMVD